jgi:hypothetical protein
VSNNAYERQREAILRLPDDDGKQIVWIVYNNDMVKGTMRLIEELRGEEFLRKVKVVSRMNSSKYNGRIHFDPTLHDLLGNGYG